MDEAIVVNKGEDLIDLPPGFRFHPTDEEIISAYLTEKVDEWVVCRVFHKNTGIKKTTVPEDLLRINSFGEDLLDCTSLPPLMDPSFSNAIRPSSHFSMRENQHQPLHQQDQKIFHQPPNNYTPITTYQPFNPSLYQQTSGPNPSFSFQVNPNPVYLHQGRSSSIPGVADTYGFGVTEPGILRSMASNSGKSDLERQCKVEPFSSNQSMVSRSQDTGLSTDMNNEISSVVSKHDVGSSRPYDDLEAPSISPIAELEGLWDY
uniref:NAC protein 5 n=1 Tax=Casuarina equisetifolia TaxID=3523 RepID=A0AA49X7N3_CASEQ|nr:NAC protein 5 [Casuarina equisetifolia]